MVCDKCEKKLQSVITPDVWKAGATNTIDSGLKLGENKILAKNNKKSRKSKAKCRICKDKVHQQLGNFCQSCAYKKGICSICGRKILDTSMYRQSAV